MYVANENGKIPEKPVITGLSGTHEALKYYSHSIVAGGLGVIS